MTDSLSFYNRVWDSGCLLMFPDTPGNLNFENISLGSYVFQGELPDYLERDFDSILLNHFRQDGNPLTLLGGPPKSGKTRSLLQLLIKKANPTSKVFWLKPHPKALETLLPLLDYGIGEDLIFVMDDLQKLSPGLPGGLTLPVLSALTDKGKLVGTVNDVFLEKAASRNHDREVEYVANFDPGLSKILRENTINIRSRLSEEEIKKAIDLFELEGGAHTGIENLGAYFSAGDAHLAQLHSLSKGNNLERAMFSALVSCQIISLNGFHLYQLEDLTWHFFSNNFPNAVWNENRWMDLISDITGGNSEASVHSLLMRNPDDPESFGLMDYVWEKFSSSRIVGVGPLGNQIPDPEQIDIDRLDAAVSALKQDFIYWAEEFLRDHMDLNRPISIEASVGEAGDFIPSEALNCWAYLKWRKGELDEALKSYSALIDFLETETNFRESIHTWHSYLETILMRAQCLSDLSEKDEAIAELESVIVRDPTYAPAYSDLAQLLKYSENKASAEYFIRTAVTLDPGNLGYKIQLGSFLDQNMTSETAKAESKEIFESSLDLPGLTLGQAILCHQALGHSATGEGRYKEAQMHYEKASELDPDQEWAFLALAHVHRKMGNLVLSRNIMAGVVYDLPYFVGDKDLFEELLEIEEELGNKEAIESHKKQRKQLILKFLGDFHLSLWDLDKEAFEELLEIEEELGNKEAIESHKKRRFEAQLGSLSELLISDDNENPEQSYWDRLEKEHPHLVPVVEEYLLRIQS